MCGGENMNDIAKRLLDSINASGLSYGDLSKMTGVPKSALQRYATGYTEKIPIPRIQAIASAVGVTAEYLLGWEKEETPVTESDDELDLILKQLLLQLPEKRLNKLLRLSPASLELLLEYADFLAERESNGSSGK